MKTPRFNWLYIKIGLYGVLLYTVVTAMRYVKSSSFSNNVEVLMGSPSQSRHLEWCSSSVQAVHVVKLDTTVVKPEVVQHLCRIAYSSYKSDEILGIKWVTLMKSMSDRGVEVVVESDERLRFIKTGGLIYKVEGFKEILNSLGLHEN